MTQPAELYECDLTDEQVRALTLPEQIKRAVYEGAHTLPAIADETTFDEDWVGQMIEDLLAEGELETDGESDDVILPADVLPEDDPEDDDTTESEPEDDGTDSPEFATHADYSDAEVYYSDAEALEITDESPASNDYIEYAEAFQPEDPGPLPVKEDDAVDVEPSEGASGRLPVDRNYDWSDEKLSDTAVEDYVSANGEYDDIMVEMERRDETGRLPRFRLTGPTGSGKTSVGENVALDIDAPVIEINCHDGLRPNNLLGMPTYVGDETWWVDGPLTKALLASQDREVVLILDEVNRTNARTLGVVMSALDHQCRVTLNARGGEVIQGDPMNLIVFATMNEGDGYVVNQQDRAQTRRFGNTFETDYIGMHDPDEEAELIARRTPIGVDVAKQMVVAANDVRKKATSDDPIKMGIPTSAMLAWARTAWAYRDDDSADGGPLVKAGRLSVVNPFYRGDSSVRSTVETTIETHLRDMDLDYAYDAPLDDVEPIKVSGIGARKNQKLKAAGFQSVENLRDASQADLADVEGIGNALAAKIKAAVDPDSGDAAADDDGLEVADAAWYVCQSCGWLEETDDVDAQTATTMACPECSGTLVPREDPDG